MQSKELFQDFKKDVEFANWQDTLNVSVNKQIKSKTILASFAVPNAKLQLVSQHGLALHFMNGNKILKKVYIANVIKDKNFENEISDFFSVSFGSGREIYRSFMSVAVKNFRV